jgi:hypothetical protein
MEQEKLLADFKALLLYFVEGTEECWGIFSKDGNCLGRLDLPAVE